MSEYRLVPVGVDELSQFIREVDGRNTMGAGALAEKIVERFGQSLAGSTADRQPFEWPLLDAPALIGGAVVGKGCSTGTVVAIAKRKYQYETEHSPEEHARREKAFKDALRQIHEGISHGAAEDMWSHSEQHPAPGAGGLENEVRTMVGLLANGEWAGTHPRTDLGEALECQITKLVDRRATPDVSALVESLENMLGAFDTPIIRRKVGSGFSEEAIGSAHAALAAHRKQGGDHV